MKAATPSETEAKEMDFKKFKKYAKRIWRFLVHEDSWASFIADAILIVVIGKFIILPLIGLAMGTPLPAVAVVTSSMDHHELEFNTWWDLNKDWYLEQGISKEEFESFYLSNGFEKGDIILMKGVPFEEIEIGDIVVYESPSGMDIIHRVVHADDFVGAKGDANSGQLYFEISLDEDDIKGKAIGKVPVLGWVKVVFVDLFNALK